MKRLVACAKRIRKRTCLGTRRVRIWSNELRCARTTLNQLFFVNQRISYVFIPFAKVFRLPARRSSSTAKKRGISFKNPSRIGLSQSDRAGCKAEESCFSFFTKILRRYPLVRCRPKNRSLWTKKRPAHAAGPGKSLFSWTGSDAGRGV